MTKKVFPYLTLHYMLLREKSYIVGAREPYKGTKYGTHPLKTFLLYQNKWNEWSLLVDSISWLLNFLRHIE